MFKGFGVVNKKSKLAKHIKDVEKRHLLKNKKSIWFYIGGFARLIVKFWHSYKYWILVVAVIALISLIYLLSQTWIVKTTFSQVITYPKTTVLGKNLGNLNSTELETQLSKLKSDFELKNITLVNDKSSWTFAANKLGVIFDASSTKEAIIKLNKLSIADKYKLLNGEISSNILPKILVDKDACANSLSVIPVVQTDAKDATIYFDQVLKIESETSGKKFNAALTCQDLAQNLANGLTKINVSLDILGANYTKANIEPKLANVQSIIDNGLELHNSSGSYRLSLSAEQLWNLFEITKKDTEVQINWSSSKLDNLVADIASKVNTYDPVPAISGCQYLISSGGNWLDQAATKKIFTELSAKSARSYSLSIPHYDSRIGSIKPINQSTRGTIYLTYDDGLTYGDRIMNLAACYGIKVTFFELGSRVNTDAAQLRRAINEGHAVQSHGYEHAAYDYGARSYSWQLNDMARSISAITNITGIRPTYFRPPGGNRSDSTYQAAAANGLKLILWGDASRDSAPSGVTSAVTCANVLAGAYPGASVLMHSTKQSTAEALPCIAEGLAARGYNMQALR